MVNKEKINKDKNKYDFLNDRELIIRYQKVKRRIKSNFK